MMNYFIFLASDTDPCRLAKPSAYQVAKYRLGRGEWGLARLTRHRMDLRIGDTILIYVSGRRDLSQHFLASCNVSSLPTPIPAKLANLVDAPDQQGISPPFYSVALKNVSYLPNPVPIQELRTQLSFIKQPNSKKWGAYLQGGVVRMTPEDYRLICKRAKQRKTPVPCIEKLPKQR
jgi:predicted RNA-binding protein with PUA-like domain